LCAWAVEEDGGWGVCEVNLFIFGKLYLCNYNLPLGKGRYKRYNYKAMIIHCKIFELSKKDVSNNNNTILRSNFGPTIIIT
jgi:hypothetical protein